MHGSSLKPTHGGDVLSRFPDLQGLMKSNEEWSEETRKADPELLQGLSKGQAPKYVWIGCADSRVPESVILKQKPGEVFVLRNVANQFNPDDDSANGLLEYAVGPVGVEHVIVCGHSGCGGCVVAHGLPDPTLQANDTSDTPLMRFIDPIVRLRHAIKGDCSVDTLIEENVKRGVENVCNSPAMQDSWSRAGRGEGKQVWVHGWVYDIKSGRLRDLGISVGPPSTQK